MGKLILNGRNYSGLVDAQGVFIDTDNVITSGTWSNSYTYTATQDCVVVIGLASISSGVATITVDGETVQGIYSTSGSAVQETYCISLKKGQVLVATSGYAAWTARYAVYGIQMGSQVTFLSEYASACYDTDEREVGCWVDGKPLYQITLVFPLTSSDVGTYLQFAHNIANVENICNCLHYLHSTSSGAWYSRMALVSATSQSANANSQYSSSSVGVDRTNVVYMIGSELYNSGYDELIVTLQYTKTTDTAGSGTWTPMATPTHHYSTDEKVVGTWIDGKPIYETTFSFTIGSTHSTVYQTGIANIDRIVNQQGQIDRGDGWFLNLNYSRWDAGANDLIGTMMNVDGRVNVFVNDAFYYGMTVYMTVQYTKTTN